MTSTKHGGEPNPLDTEGLCLLSLDGGGVRGLSTLYILKSIMDRLNHELKKDPPIKPCQVFDLIGGTSTGGLIAIMLGRLEMSVDECIAAYSELAGAVFGERLHRVPVNMKLRVQPRFDSARLENAIRKVVTQGGASETALFNDGIERGCRTFVCSIDRNTKNMVRLRSYSIDEPSIRATVCEAALATSAATTFFDPVRIGDRTFADGGFGANNPVDEVEGEAANIWCSDNSDLKPLVKCFISIGTGNPGTKPFEDSLPKFMSETVVQIATETEATERKFIARWAKHFDEKRYFRFNVDQGLQNIGLEEYKSKGAIEAASEGYLTHMAQKIRVRDCIQNLRLKQSAAAADLLYLIEEYEIKRTIEFRTAPRAEVPWIVPFQKNTQFFGKGRNPRSREDGRDRSPQTSMPLTDPDELETEKIIKWLSPSEAYQKQEAMFALRQEHTCQWVLDSSEFHNWKAGRSRVLWCHGIPGSGKTIVASYVIHYLEECAEMQGFGLAYMFLDHKELTPLVELLAMIWEQLLPNRKILPKGVMDLYERCNRKEISPSVKDVLEILKAQVNSLPQVFIVVDGLDEREEAFTADLLQKLRGLGTRVSLMVTSRFEPHQNEAMETRTLKIFADKDDIRATVRSWISQSPRLGLHTRNDGQLREFIIETVVERSEGMFLLAKLHMNLLQTKTSPSAIRETLEQLPNELNETYEEALQRIEHQDEEAKSVATRVLQWVLLAFEPMTITELQHALAIKPNAHTINPAAQPPMEFITTFCAGLIVVDKRSSIIRFAHGTIQEFFHQHWRPKFSEGHTEIATTCLTYLLMDDIAEGPCKDEQQSELRFNNYPLLPYCARHWGDHVRESNNPDVFTLAWRFLANGSVLQSSLQAGSPIFPILTAASIKLPMQVAMEFGLTSIAVALLDIGDTPPNELDHLLAVAVDNAQVSVAVKLLRRGAQISTIDGKFRMAFQSLAWKWNDSEADTLRMELQKKRKPPREMSYEDLELLAMIKMARNLDKGDHRLDGLKLAMRQLSETMQAMSNILNTMHEDSKNPIRKIK